MLSHTFTNKWQKGLLSLFGYLDPLYWTILMALAEHADENGHILLTDKQLCNLLVRDNASTRANLGRLRKIGLIRTARRRESHIPVKGYHPVEKHPRLLELYAGLKDGKLPPVDGVTKIRGLMPSYFYQGRQVKWQTSKLIRQKFKAKKQPPVYEETYVDKLNSYALKTMVPSASYRRRMERERVQRLYEIEVKKRHTRALNFHYF